MGGSPTGLGAKKAILARFFDPLNSVLPRKGYRNPPAASFEKSTYSVFPTLGLKVRPHAAPHFSMTLRTSTRSSKELDSAAMSSA